jgi:hypothetical protein
VSLRGMERSAGGVLGLRVRNNRLRTEPAVGDRAPGHCRAALRGTGRVDAEIVSACLCVACRARRLLWQNCCWHVSSGFLTLAMYSATCVARAHLVCCATLPTAPGCTI